MGTIREEIEHPELPIKITTIERAQDEVKEPWCFIRVDIEHEGDISPVDLREMGYFLVREGRRIGREYTSKGSKKRS